MTPQKEKSREKEKPSSWRNIERLLCATLIILYAFLLWTHVGEAVGFDWSSHIDMVSAVRFMAYEPHIYTMFYGYHPPLAFLAARIFLLLGASPVVSVQITSALAMFITFLSTRETLRLLGLLNTPHAVAFLYLTFALPINVYLSYSVNMDALIFAFAAGTMYFSVRMLPSLQKKGEEPRGDRSTMVGMTVMPALAMMTKFTGVLLLAIPPAVFLFLVPRHTRRTMIVPVCAVVCAVLLVLPYYSVRYYLPYGSWFPSNTDHFDASMQQTARAERDADRIGFITNLFLPSPVHDSGLQFRDLTHPRLSDPWKDIWMMDQWVKDRREGGDPSPAGSIGFFYLLIAPALLVGGFLLFLKRLSCHDTWSRFGFVILSFSFLLICALIAYVYRNPWAGSLANKAIYIAPATLGIGYLLAEFFRDMKDTLPSKTLFMAILLTFLIFNFGIPVY